jgi:hypothetical protein
MNALRLTASVGMRGVRTTTDPTLLVVGRPSARYFNSTLDPWLRGVPREPARTCGVAHPPNSYWMPTRRVPEPGSGRPGIGFGGLCLTQGDVTNQRYTRAIRSGTKRGSCPELPIDLDSTMQIVLPTAYLLATSTRDLPSYYQCRTESSMRCAVDE